MKLKPSPILLLLIGLTATSCEKGDEGKQYESPPSISLANSILNNTNYVGLKFESGNGVMLENSKIWNRVGCVDELGVDSYRSGNFCSFRKKDGTAPEFKVFFFKYFPQNEISFSDVDGMFELREYAFSSRFGDPMDGVAIEWMDSNYVSWASYLGSGDQTGSEFRIVSREPESNATSSFTTSAVFKCKLYNLDGDSLLVTKGEYKSLTGCLAN